MNLCKRSVVFFWKISSKDAGIVSEQKCLIWIGFIQIFWLHSIVIASIIVIRVIN